MKPASTGSPLRLRLFLLAASGLVPLALVAIAVLGYLAGERGRHAQTSALTVSRALGTAVDAELRATMSVLDSLAAASELQPGRLPEFHALARRVATSQGWRAVLVADAGGRPVLSTQVEPDAPVPGPSDQQSMARAVATRQPVVGRVLPGGRGGTAFAVRVPVLRHGELAFVLSAVLPVERVASVVQRQRLNQTSVVAVFDHTGTRVARSQQHASARPSPSLQALLDTGAAEGSGPTRTLEGRFSHTGFSRLPASGWVVATGISTDEADSGLLGVLGAVGAGLLASLGLSAFLAWYFARGVTEPILALKAAASALGRGEPVQVPPLGIAELREVATALETACADGERAARERRAAEVEREALLARATEALRLAKEAGRSKDEFLAMLGHELRNPLAPMATALHLMARKGDERTRAEREVMQRQVAHMRRLVDDLLDVSRITAQRLTMQFRPLPLADLVRHAAQGVEPALDERRFALQLAPDALDLWVSGDEVRLGQVLANLLGNALKFSRPDGQLALRLRRDGDCAEIEVADDGLGMPPQVLEHVFELFYQAPQGADRPFGGLGLGLAIVRSLVHMHGGSVRALSGGPGKGSAFVVRLPLVPPPGTARANEVQGELAGTGARVLLVDDNQDAADTAAALLEISGHEVRVAYEPMAALAMLDHFQPQVAVLDIGLPTISGYELAARVRAHGNGAACHLVALTGYGTAADVERARAAGFHQHLVKPAAPEALLDAIEQGLARS
ncbi:MAG: hybrid sensor histidine kinase/response regulator [Ramlibacter sp.]|uniref:hybrid sensor histidine kinase/response regulator n=1 Tax=Ramlibacter sp. TaxID=1917967 RepID=UPI00262BB8E2|nr:ATP-binding protein [Ramlibacter sp.]MDB5752611.1 hybrid sensor histidine kinase/response regulator [Ramlibacter sp.]